jgi:hypothetical protein
MKELFKAIGKEMSKSMNESKYISESNKAQFNKEADRLRKNMAMLQSKLNK